SSTGWLPLDHVELVQADVGDPSPGARSALDSAIRGVDVVFHLAAVTSAATDDEYFRVNVDGTRRMATMMGEVAPEAHFVLCSSLAAAGPPRPGRPAREGDRDAPQSAYGRSKLFSEQVLAASGVRHTIVRPPAVYGPRDRDILTAFRVGARGIAVRMGPPRQRLSLVHAQDLAEGIALAGEREAGGTYYMSDGVVHLWEEVVAGIGAAVGRVPRIVPLPNPVL